MVGIVIVSHSAKLAEGVRELATQMVSVTVPISTAAGIDDPENPFGTDAMQVQEAIMSVYSDDGVVVLMDLGSAVLSAEMAIELLPEQMKSNVKLCSAPLVEGTLAAVVQAAAGAKIDRVIAEALAAIKIKAFQLSEAEIDIKADSKDIEKIAKSPEKFEKIRLSVTNTLGIHARPAAKFVTKAAQFQSQITLENLTKKSDLVNAKSINQVITLGVVRGDEIEITAVGEDGRAAIEALQQLVEDSFGEDKEIEKPKSDSQEASSDVSSSSIGGFPASPGVAIGAVIPYQPLIPEVVAQKVENSQQEWENLQLAIETAKREIEKLASTDDTGIFEAHLLFLEDPAWIDRARKLIFESNYSAAEAWKLIIEDTIAAYQSLEDPYLQNRVTDVTDVGMGVLRLLLGVDRPSIDLPHPGILVAYDLTPSEVSQLKSEQVLGICTATGSPTAHSSLIANMKGIPAIVGIGSQILQIRPSTPIAIDGSTGQVWIEPNQEQLGELEARQNQFQQLESSREWDLEPITTDGYQISLMANIIGVSDAQYAIDCGASGVGLLRTEFLYLDRLSPPSEEEQLEIYQAIAKIMDTRPLTIRTLDIGGDKPVPYLKLAKETNPFLGWRGIRQSLEFHEMLKTQFRAILRASAGHKIEIMFPMVSSVHEVRAAKVILAEVERELSEAGIEFNQEIPVGIMVEVPAAAIMAHQLGGEVNFFSIGTNDLSQYIMAADRTNPKVASLADGFEPAVLRTIQQTVVAGRVRGISVRVCGQMASDPAAIPILLGLGVDELSVNPPAMSAVMATISSLSMTEAEAIATEVLQLESARAVRELVFNRLFVE